MALKKIQINKFKKALEELKDKYTRMLQGTTEEVKKPDEATGYSQHQADQGTDDFDRRIGLELTVEEYKILKQIDRALEKIDEGSYGLCDVTSKEIPIARLEVVPYAVMTVDAQEQHERGLI